MSYLPIDLLTSERRNARRLKTDTGLQQTASGQLVTAEDTPVVQITAQYGLLSGVSTAALGGTTFTEDSKFVSSTGTGANNVAAIISSRQVKHRVGQGLKGMFTALFSEGKPDSTQEAGLISSDSALAFGYNDDEFGILYAKDGLLEIQELTITTPSNGDTAVVVVDGVGYSIPLSNGTVELNAYEIAAYLTINELRYDSSSDGATVDLRARLPDFGSGIFTFTSPSAVASWVELQPASLASEVWVKKSDWNVNSRIDFDPAMINIYMVQFESLAGAVNFYMQDPATSSMTLVHSLRYSNTSSLPIVEEAVYRIGWANRNKGNTTDIRTEGSSGSIFIEGQIVDTTQPIAHEFLQESIGQSNTNILALRNRGVFNGKVNRTDILPQKAYLFNEASKTAIFDIYAEPTVPAGDYIAWEYHNEALDTAEIATNKVLITGGNVVASIAVAGNSSVQVNINEVISNLPSIQSFSICARLAGNGTASDMGASINWIEDK